MVGIQLLLKDIQPGHDTLSSFSACFFLGCFCLLHRIVSQQLQIVLLDQVKQIQLFLELLEKPCSLKGSGSSQWFSNNVSTFVMELVRQLFLLVLLFRTLAGSLIL